MRRRPRPLTVVCHLLTEPAIEGRVVGQLAVVNTGETVAITNVNELIALIERAASLEPRND